MADKEKHPIRVAREAAGMTQAAAAKYCHGVPLRTWEDWERGAKKMTPYLERFIVDYLIQYSENK